ncbi:hypothetical protein R3P38DRAFT_3466882 [Favolaschia claudopus]|uniref:Uncharacterized protein n=1 Tax=Favolaschia claudopus TaxID=2862362 RepID=A0AAW0CJX6_9AGAR
MYAFGWMQSNEVIQGERGGQETERKLETSRWEQARWKAEKWQCEIVGYRGGVVDEYRGGCIEVNKQRIVLVLVLIGGSIWRGEAWHEAQQRRRRAREKAGSVNDSRYNRRCGERRVREGRGTGGWLKETLSTVGQCTSDSSKGDGRKKREEISAILEKQKSTIARRAEKESAALARQGSVVWERESEAWWWQQWENMGVQPQELHQLEDRKKGGGGLNAEDGVKAMLARMKRRSDILLKHSSTWVSQSSSYSKSWTWATRNVRNVTFKQLTPLDAPRNPQSGPAILRLQSSVLLDQPFAHRHRRPGALNSDVDQ